MDPNQKKNIVSEHYNCHERKIHATFQNNNKTLDTYFIFSSNLPVIKKILSEHEKNQELISSLIGMTLNNIVDEALSFFPTLFGKKFNLSSYGHNKDASLIKGSINIVTPQNSYSFYNNGDSPLFQIMCDLSMNPHITFFKSHPEEIFNHCMYKCIGNNITSDLEITPPTDEISKTNGDL